MKKYCIYVAVLCSCSLFLGCNSSKHAIKSGKWEIESVYGEGITPENRNRSYIEIDEEKGMIGGYDGCNSFGGSFTINKQGKISVDNVITTTRYCPESEEKMSLSKALGAVADCRTKNDNGKQYLILTDNEGKECITLYKTINAE